MRTTGWLAIALFALASVGCAPKDFFPTPLVDVTGLWEGTYQASIVTNLGGPTTRQIRMTLRQNGPKVKGEGLLSSATLSVDGGIEGEVFNGRIGSMQFELTVIGNEMTGPAEGLPSCTCRVKLRRVGAPNE